MMLKNELEDLTLKQEKRAFLRGYLLACQNFCSYEVEKREKKIVKELLKDIEEGKI